MRRQDWPRRLQAFVRARRSMPFEFGANDCVTLTADWIEECTGLVIERGWHDEISALREIKARGGMTQAVSEVLGAPIDWRLAQRGDAVLVVVDGRETMGVCVGEYALVPGLSGALLHPLVNDAGEPCALHAWRVG